MEAELTGRTIYEYIVEDGMMTIYYLDGTIKQVKHTRAMEDIITCEMMDPFIKQYEGVKGPINRPKLVFIKGTYSKKSRQSATLAKTYFLVQDRKEKTLKKSMDDFEEEINDIRNVPSIKTYTNVDDDYRYKHHSYSYVYKKEFK